MGTNIAKDYSVFQRLRKSYKELAINITRDMGLRMCGVDIISQGDIRAPFRDYVIIEINSAPGLDNYASLGANQQSRVDELYLKVLQALELT